MDTTTFEALQTEQANDATGTGMQAELNSETDAASCWQAVLERDRSRDGAFVYAVCSTRIYCRPSCPSRRPRRSSTRFFASSQPAAAAGFRPCKRCRPLEPLAPGALRVREACRLIEENDGPPLTLEQLSRQVGGSAFHLQRSFK